MLDFKDNAGDFVLGGSDGKESACNAGDLGSISGLASHSSILAWKSHGQRSLAGYSPWGHKASDKTKQLSVHRGPCQTETASGPPSPDLPWARLSHSSFSSSLRPHTPSLGYATLCLPSSESFRAQVWPEGNGDAPLLKCVSSKVGRNGS